MKFCEIVYTRPNFEDLLNTIDNLVSSFNNCKNANEQFDIYNKIYDSSSNYYSQYAVARIRNRINTNDAFYKEEIRFFLETSPILNQSFKKLTALLLSSKFKNELEEKIGKIHFIKKENHMKISSNDTIADIQKENSLILEYTSLISNLTAEFEGETLSLSQLSAYKESPSLSLRKKAYLAESNALNSINDKLDEIFDKLVKVRTTQAKKLGFSSYTELAYIKMNRISYSKEDIKIFKNNILTHLTPIVLEIIDSRKKRLNLEKITFSDLLVPFSSGSAKLNVFGDDILLKGKEMYYKISDELGDFMDFMIKHELFDIHSKTGKSPGGFCSYIEDLNYPFIFANFNNTPVDAYIIFHEFGHAFARHIANKNYNSSNDSEYSMDIAECHSMIMEVLTLDYCDSIFGEDALKYKLTQVENALIFLSYTCQVDEFQERIYDNPNLSPKQRDDLWLEIENKYRSYIDYDNLPFYKDGSGWKRQAHIFRTPFYYIDYGLAQIIALQFFEKTLTDYDNAFKTYIDFVNLSGSKSFTDALNTLGLVSPFSENPRLDVLDRIFKWTQDNKPL